MQIELEAPAFTTAHTPEGWQVTMPMQKQWGKSLVTLIWLCGWLFGEIVVSQQLLAGTSKAPVLFLVLWLLLWTTGGVIALVDLLWHVTGHEHIIVSGNTLHHVVVLLGRLRTTRSYDTTAIQNLRATERGRPNLRFNFSFFQTARGQLGTVAFDFGGRTFHFGASLETAAARTLIEQLQTRLPQRFAHA